MDTFHFRPARLREEEEAQVQAADEGTFDGSGDYGAYRGYNRGVNFEWVRPHGISDNFAAGRYAADVVRLCKVPAGASICDLGSGLGFVTDALRRAADSGETVGVELSQDGVSYARRTYRGCEFVQMGIEPTSTLGRVFDVVHAKSFYPFSRTNALDINHGYLQFCSRHLKQGGLLVVTILEGTDEPGLLDNIRRHRVAYEELALSPFGIQPLSYSALRNQLPLPLAHLATRAVRAALGKKGALLCSSRRL